MDVLTAARRRRSIRLFDGRKVPAGTLRTLVDAARLYASGGNRQPLAFAAVTEEKNCAAVFASLNWAMYLKDFQIPEGARPPAYVLLLDGLGSGGCAFDAGAAATTLMLGAQDLGLESCCLQIARPKELQAALGLTKRPLFAVALGYGAVESSEASFTGSVEYYRDEAGNFHVPKRSLKEVLVFSDEA